MLYKTHLHFVLLAFVLVIHSCCWNKVHKSLQGNACGEVCSLLDNLMECNFWIDLSPIIVYITMQGCWGEKLNALPCLCS